MKLVDYIPDKAYFAQAPEWEDAINAAIKIWLKPASIGDRRKLIDIFNAMLYRAPEASNGWTCKKCGYLHYYKCQKCGPIQKTGDQL